MIYWKDKIKKIVALLLLSSILVSTSCKKEDDKNTVGSDVIGNRAGFDLRVDTFDVTAYSCLADSIAETNMLPYYLLGQMNDPDLGTTTANIITQFSIPFENFTFDGTIDSVVVQLRYAGATGVYGNNTNQSIKVYELTEDLPASDQSSLFNSRKTYNYNPSEIGSFFGSFATTDSVKITVGEKEFGYAPQFRIKITDQSFISRLQSLSSVQEADFKTIFKGLVISAEQQSLSSGQGALAYMLLSNSESNVAVYITQTNGVQEKYDLPISRASVSKTNEYKHSGQPALQPVNGGTHQLRNYIQAAGGIKTRILIPGLAQLAADKAIAVNNARLVITAEPSMVYAEPTRLIPYGANEDGTLASIADFSEIYGGLYNASANTYSFNVNRYVQEILTTYHQQKKDINYGFNITIPSGDINAARRVILNTDNSNPADRKLKFILTYAVIK